MLIAGTESDLPTIRTLLDSLCEQSYGQVLLELPPGQQAPAEVPDRVTVHVVRRDAGEPAGRRLARALTLWAHEWLVDGDRGLREAHRLWIGAQHLREVHLVREVLFGDCCAHQDALTATASERSILPDPA